METDIIGLTSEITEVESVSADETTMTVHPCRRMRQVPCLRAQAGCEPTTFRSTVQR